MARPRSEDKREAIIDAAIRVIAAQGISAATATIAREAGVANGSLFTYFATKSDLLNALYVELKTEMGAAAGGRVANSSDAKMALRHVWADWVEWATERPERRRVLSLLSTADEVTAASRDLGHKSMAPVAELLERCRQAGAMRNANLGFLSALMTAAADATIDFMISDPTNADRYRDDGFEALWRILA